MTDQELKDLVASFAVEHRKTELMMQENAIAQKETDRKIAEGFAKTEQLFDRLGIKVDDINSRVEGIGNSNGKFAEEYFFNSLENKMEFAGMRFDYISRDFNLLRKTSDGKRIEDQFDIVLFNGKAAALIEVKYKARSSYLKNMISQKVSNFRFLFPKYAKHKIYSGLGGFSFEKNVAKEAEKLGIGLLKQVGESIEYETSWVRAY